MREENFLGTRPIQSWYLIASSQELQKNQILEAQLGRHKVVLFRNEHGIAGATDAYCPHLGADLSDGCVTQGKIRCAFHHWTFRVDGKCETGERDATSYPVLEKHGAIWLFSGPSPLFGIPEMDQMQATILKPRVVRAHPHLLTPNGLDIEHFSSVHGIHFSKQPVFKTEPFGIAVDMEIDLNASKSFRMARLFAGNQIKAKFYTLGGHISVIRANAGAVPLHVIFTHRPQPDGTSISRTLLFFPERMKTPSILYRFLSGVFLYFIVRDDVRLLENVQFRSENLKAGEGLALFRDQINQMETMA